jgi:SAM-dependent methyltransferase
MSVSDPDTPIPDPITERRDALAARLDAAIIAMFELCTVYLGERLGYYDALADGALTSTELAAMTGTAERFAREWLEQQTVTGLLAVEDPALGPTQRRFALPSGHTDVLVDHTSDANRAAGIRLAVGLTRPLAAVLAAHRSGGGVPLEAYGADVREAMADFSREGSKWIIAETLPAALPDVHARLQGDPPAYVAEIGCGAGWLTTRLAQAYPAIHVDGFDLDAPSVALARQNVAAAGLTERVRILHRDAGDPELAGRYDLVVAEACLHDASQPIAVLRTMRRLAGEAGTVLVMEPKAGDRFLDPANNPEVERFHYAFSVLHCLPVGMADQPSAGTGTMMRPNILRDYAREAGFRDVEVLPVDDDWSAAFRLRS